MGGPGPGLSVYIACRPWPSKSEMHVFATTSSVTPGLTGSALQISIPAAACTYSTCGGGFRQAGAARQEMVATGECDSN